MAVTRTARGTAQSKTSGTTLQIAAQSLNIDDLLVVYLAYDDEVLNNVFWGTQQMQLGTAVLGAGVRVRLAWCVADATASRTIDATWNAALVSKAMVADSFRSSVTGGGQTWLSSDDQSAQNTGLGTAASTAATGPVVGGTESIRVGVVGTEGPTGDTAGTFVEPNTLGQRIGTTGNPANSNVTVSSAYRISPTAGSTTGLSKTGMTSRDWGAAIRSFNWAVPPTVVGGSFTADAVIRAGVAGNFTADAIISAAVAGSFTADAEIAEGAPTGAVWTGPANNTTVEDLTPTLEFDMPLAHATDMYFEIQLDTVNTFDSGNLRVYRSFPDSTGWEYHDGSSWLQMPASGVGIAYSGNAARFTVPTPLTTGTWYRRVRVG